MGPVYYEGSAGTSSEIAGQRVRSGVTYDGDDDVHVAASSGHVRRRGQGTSRPSASPRSAPGRCMYQASILASISPVESGGLT